MAFDQTTRNRLHRFVSQSRAILMEEFTRQLQAAYGMDPANGTVADVDTLSFLDNEGQQTAVLLRETLAHYVAAIPGKSEKEKIRQGLDRIIREQSFTVLNRLAALRMAEARGFLIESISRGTSSKGFQLYKNLAGTALGETGDAYRCFLFSLFDEFSLDLAVLFDRHSVQGRLFPREAALLALLEQINHFEIEPLWAEDETIGWIYQYFNSQEERKQMRKASQAPRNSRELAVRNQFFTPRYVVEFLTDNTLGRIWYDMTQGHTALKDICRYLVRRPNEIFLAPGETAPETAEEHPEAMSQEELLQQPVHVPFRKLKDPRELRMLDPACGSMHFGLYAFDLFETIYEEAWHIETELGPDVFDRSKHLKPLQETYAGVDEFKKAIPQLIIEQNIHGVDIDPRAVQIAGLSLWQRAQRAWHQMGIKPGHRPAIRKSNIVCAEPMPGEKELLREFTAGLNPPVLGQLVETIFDKMQLAGEAGTLLKIEQEITSAISDAKDAYSTELLRQKEQEGFLPGMAPKREPTLFDFAELHNDSDFWETAEEKILTALKNYAAQAESHEGQKRLFAEDAAKGFAFIDLCRKRFDVVLMNPPFGLSTNLTTSYFEHYYPDTFLEMYASSASRGLNLLNSNGLVGSISSRAFLTVNRLQAWRENELIEHLDVILDLGHGVMDSAMVESAAYTIRKDKLKNNLLAFDATEVNSNDRHNWLSLNIPNYCISRIKLFSFPRKKILYNAPKELFKLFNSRKVFEPSIGTVRQGMGTFDDFRFVHLSWEVPIDSIGMSDIWEPLTKGGSYSRYYADIYLVLKWDKNGSELSAVNIAKNGQDAQIRQASSFWRKPGSTYSKRSQKGFSARALPSNCILTGKGPAILSTSKIKNLFILGWINSRLIRSLIEMQANFGEYNTGILKQLPWFDNNHESKKEEDALRDLLNLKISIISFLDETNAHYTKPFFKKNIKETTNQINQLIKELNSLEKKVSNLWDSFVDKLYGVDSTILLNEDDPAVQKQIPKVKKKDICFFIISYSVGRIFGRWENEKIYQHDLLFKAMDPFGPLPVRGKNTLTANNDCGIYFEDFNSNESFGNQVILFIDEFFGANTAQDISNTLNCGNIIQYLNSTNCFFDNHLKQYAKSRRQAPIYWPLQTPSGSYTLWVYYHRLTDQTLYTCVNDFVEPKLKTVTDDLTALRSQTTRSRAEEKELARLSDLEGELKDFRDELLRIAGFWKPDLNDGVQITAAPLWKLFQHRQWQKKLKDTWKKLENGEYDWAHLACSIWPERVLRKCHSDRSLAIAHDVENDFWEEIEVPVIRRGKDTGKTKLEWQPKPLTESRLQELIHQKKAAMRSSH